MLYKPTRIDVRIGYFKRISVCFLLGIGMICPVSSWGQDCIDYEDPQGPQIVGSVDTPSYAYGVTVSSTHAYVSDANSGLQVIEITNPQSPQIVGSVDTPGFARGVAVSGIHAYVADYLYGLQVIDITNPQNPQIVGSVDTPGRARKVAISGTYAYIADSESGLQVIDITDPQSPQIAGGVDTPGEAFGVTVSGTHAYVADGSGLLVIDITNPQNPQIVGGMDTPSDALRVTVEGIHVYVADYESGLQILPIQCEGSTPVKMLSFIASLNPAGVLLEWETTSETNHAGFHVYRRAVGASWERITDRLIAGGPKYSHLDPRPAAGIRYQYEIESLARTGETERFGPVEIEVPLLTGITLRAAPNPSTGVTAIYCTLPDSGPVSMQVFDLSGRLVRVLVDSFKSAGPHEMKWNAEDDSGRSVPAGIYFVTLDTRTGSKALRVTITK